MAQDDEAIAGAATAVALPDSRPGDESHARNSLELAAGQQVGRFVLSAKLGEGGMGEVFIARDPELQRDVALKVLRPHGSGTGGTQAQQRMLREAQAMAMLSHPNLVAIYEVGTFQKNVFIAMEYVVGNTLDDWLEQGHALEDIWEVFEQAGYALQAIHDAGLIHRDFKPANVIVTPDGIAKVLDLGIARKVDDDTGEAARACGPAESVAERAGPVSDLSEVAPEFVPVSESSLGADAFASELTQEGALVGTPSYMPPEQLLSQPVQPASDQFAFAIAFFEALTGSRPFPGNGLIEIVANIVAGEIRPWPKDSEVPLKLRQALSRALEHDPTDRYPSMVDFLAALREGLGLRAQIRYLTARWQDHRHEKEYLLAEGSLLVEGKEILKNQPHVLNAEQRDFIQASEAVVRRRRVSRRVITWGLGAVTLGLIPTALLLERRSRQLESSIQAEVQANISAIREAVSPVLKGADDELMMMFAQRGAWMPLLRQLLEVEGPPGEGVDRKLKDAVQHVNDYFRPIVDRSPTISSLMVASDEEMEVLVFRDPDAHDLSPPYDFYNRYVRRPAFGEAAFEVFWSDGHVEPDRYGWMRPGQPNSRGQEWTGYRPTQRVWFQNAIQSEEARTSWTKPYLFFVSKDAGVTGSVAWKVGERRYVLAIDFMLTDLSLITTQLDSPGFLAAIVSKAGECIGLPKDPRFSTTQAVRDFFAGRNRTEQSSLDAIAHLPSVEETGPPVLVSAQRPYSLRSQVYQFVHEGEELWAGRAPIGDPSLGLSIYVVQKPPG